MKSPHSYVLNSVLSTGVLRWVLDLSRGDRGLVDWIVVTAVGSALLWNLLQLARRLHRHSGGAGLTHLSRTLTLWVVGLANLLPELGSATPTWRLPVGSVILLLGVADAIWLYRRERRAIAVSQTEPADSAAC